MIAHLSYVLCDRCGAAGSLGDSAAEARLLARRAGWERRNWNKRLKDVCPACVSRSPQVEPREGS